MISSAAKVLIGIVGLGLMEASVPVRRNITLKALPLGTRYSELMFMLPGPSTKNALELETKEGNAAHHTQFNHNWSFEDIKEEPELELGATSESQHTEMVNTRVLRNIEKQPAIKETNVSDKNKFDEIERLVESASKSDLKKVIVAIML